MRGILKYGVPAAAGLGVGGYALSQGEDPGSAALAAGAGALGGAAGLLGARKLAGKYGPMLANADRNVVTPEIAEKLGMTAVQGPIDPSVQRKGPTRAYGKAIAAGLVPTSALAAGLGGVAAGAIPGALGLPGFQQGMAIDPEGYSSNNTPSAQFGVKSLASTQYV
jgi:hypothetical protein